MPLRVVCSSGLVSWVGLLIFVLSSRLTARVISAIRRPVLRVRVVRQSMWVLLLI